MNAFLVGLSLVSAATAQVANGVSAIPYSAVYGSSSQAYSTAAASSSNGYAAYTQAASSSSAASSSMITQAPSSSSYDIYSAMPYSSFMSGGYKSLDCGYGYQKMSDGSCQAMSWWNTQGCYETIIINHG